MDEAYLGAQTLYVIGLATDYCVKQTVLDACKLGFRVVVTACAGSVEPGDADRALKASGSRRLAHSADLGVQ